MKKDKVKIEPESQDISHGHDHELSHDPYIKTALAAEKAGIHFVSHHVPYGPFIEIGLTAMLWQPYYEVHYIDESYRANPNAFRDAMIKSGVDIAFDRTLMICMPLWVTVKSCEILERPADYSLQKIQETESALQEIKHEMEREGGFKGFILSMALNNSIEEQRRAKALPLIIKGVAKGSSMTKELAANGIIEACDMCSDGFDISNIQVLPQCYGLNASDLPLPDLNRLNRQPILASGDFSPFAFNISSNSALTYMPRDILQGSIVFLDSNKHFDLNTGEYYSPEILNQTLSDVLDPRTLLLVAPTIPGDEFIPVLTGDNYGARICDETSYNETLEQYDVVVPQEAEECHNDTAEVDGECPEGEVTQPQEENNIAYLVTSRSSTSDKPERVCEFNYFANVIPSGVVVGGEWSPTQFGQVKVGIELNEIDSSISERANLYFFKNVNFGHGSVIIYGDTYWYDFKTCKPRSRDAVCEVGTAGFKLPEIVAPFKLPSRVFGWEKKKNKLMQEAGNLALTHLVQKKFQVNYKSFRSEFNSAMENNDFQKARCLAEEFYNKYEGMPGLEEQRMATEHHIFTTEKYHRISINIEAALEERDFLRANLECGHIDDPGLQQSIRTKIAAQALNVDAYDEVLIICDSIDSTNVEGLLIKASAQLAKDDIDGASKTVAQVLAIDDSNQYAQELELIIHTREYLHDLVCRKEKLQFAVRTFSDDAKQLLETEIQRTEEYIARKEAALARMKKLSDRNDESVSTEIAENTEASQQVPQKEFKESSKELDNLKERLKSLRRDLLVYDSRHSRFQYQSLELFSSMLFSVLDRTILHFGTNESGRPTSHCKSVRYGVGQLHKLISSGLQLGSHYCTRNIKMLSYTVGESESYANWTLSGARYMLLTTQGGRGAVGTFEPWLPKDKWAAKKLKSGIKWIDNYGLPILQLTTSIGYIIRDPFNLRAGFLSFYPQLLLRIPPIKNNLLFPNPNSYLSSTRLALGNALLRLQEQNLLAKLTSGCGFISGFSEPIGVCALRFLPTVAGEFLASTALPYIALAFTSLKAGQFSYAAYKGIYFSMLYSEFQSCICNKNSLPQEKVRILGKLVESIKKNGAVTSLERELYAMALLFVHNFAADVITKPSRGCGYSLFEAVSYYTDKEATALKSKTEKKYFEVHQEEMPQNVLSEPNVYAIRILERILCAPIVIVDARNKKLLRGNFSQTGETIYLQYNGNDKYDIILLPSTDVMRRKRFSLIKEFDQNIAKTTVANDRLKARCDKMFTRTPALRAKLDRAAEKYVAETKGPDIDSDASLSEQAWYEYCRAQRLKKETAKLKKKDAVSSERLKKLRKLRNENPVAFFRAARKFAAQSQSGVTANQYPRSTVL